MTKCMVAVVHHYSIQGLGEGESPRSFAGCVKFLCYLMLLYTVADQRSRIRLLAGSMTRSRQTFSIPIQSSKLGHSFKSIFLFIPDFRWDEKIHGMAETFLIMVEDV